MKVAGIEVPASVAARLALRLDQAGEIGLAHRVGIAVDTGHDVALSNVDRKTVIRVLADWPGELAELLVSLRSKLRETRHAGASTRFRPRFHPS